MLTAILFIVGIHICRHPHRETLMIRSVLLLFVSVVAIGIAHANEITIVNGSKASIHELYVAPDAATQWGDDRLGDDDLGPGASVTINVKAGSYEVRLVDEKEKECKIEDSFLTSAGTWEITDDAMSHCTGFGVAQADPENNMK